MEIVWQTVVNSAVTTVSYAVMAIGLVLIFGVARLGNFAYGEFFMVGAYTVWFLYSVSGWPYPVAVLAAIGVVAVIGLITERGIFRRLRGNVAATFMAATGLILILQVLAGQMFGLGRTKPVPPPFPGSLEIWGASVGWQRFFIIPAGIVMIGGLWFFLHHFRLGRALRATCQDAEAATLQGIGTNQMAFLAMGISCALAGAAGALMAPIYSVTPYMGNNILMMVFVVVIFGGTGSIEGALLASVMLGFLHTVIATVADSTIANIVTALIVTTVLAFRPQGLLGREKI